MTSYDKSAILDRLRFGERAPAGYHVAVRIGFAFPELEANTLPRGWVHRYGHEGLMLHDPVMRWLYDHLGAIRWSEIEIEDARNVLAAAAEFGLRFGAAISVRDPNDPGLRTFGTFTRSDREYEPDELGALERDLETLHRSLRLPDNLTEAELDTLRLLKSGHLMKEIAYELGITESAVKQRLKNAKDKLSARTTTQAVLQATEMGWLR